MADSSGDLANLSQEQHSALEQYLAVTDQDVEAAIPLLRRCQWNVQIAVARFFDGEPANVVDDIPPQIPPQDIRRQETLLNSFRQSAASASPRGSIEPAERIVPQPDDRVARRPPLLLSLVFLPFNLLFTVLSKSFSVIGYLFPFLPRLLTRLRTTNNQRRTTRRDTSGRRPLNTRDTAARFIREFEEEYGPNDLPFHENSYASAFDAAKKDLKYLLVVLVSPEHDDTYTFLRDTLLAPDVVSYIQNPANNIILWAGNVQDSEAYQVSTSLNCTKFPFAALIVHTPRVSSLSMSVVAKVAGPTPAAEFLAAMQNAIGQHNEGLSAARAQRAEQVATRSLREQQNSAYERSLAQDRERARQKREEQETRERTEREEREKVETKEREARNLEQWRRWRAGRLLPEPGADEKDAVRISVRMPSGERAIRKFPGHAQLEELYAFVECYDLLQEEKIAAGVEKPSGWEHVYKFRLVSPMPREAYELESGGTIKGRIGRSGNLIIERTEVDDETDEE